MPRLCVRATQAINRSRPTMNAIEFSTPTPLAKAFRVTVSSVCTFAVAKILEISKSTNAIVQYKPTAVDHWKTAVQLEK